MMAYLINLLNKHCELVKHVIDQFDGRIKWMVQSDYAARNYASFKIFIFYGGPMVPILISCGVQHQPNSLS